MRKLRLFAAAVLASASFAGLAQAATELQMWDHGAGSDVETKLITQVVDDFNKSQSDWVVKLEKFPQAAYNDSVTAGALANKLPDILDVDGPNMPNWAWSKYMQPLPIDEAALSKLLPGAVGKWQGKIYSVGLWDAACAIFARKSILDENGIRIPTLDKPWSGDEFTAVLKKLQATGKYDYPIDMGMAWKGEWYPYGFSPFMQSFGGDIVDRTTYKTAQKALNGEAAVKFGKWWQGIVKDKLTPGTSEDPATRDSGFVSGKFALSWNGNWAALGALEKFGKDMLFLPAPDFGTGSKIGAASWQFGVSAASKHPDGAAAFIKFALQDKYSTAFSDGIGVVPATVEAAKASKNYAPGGAMEVFYGLSTKQGLLRPVTPGYVVQAKVFEKAMADISNGADVQQTLDTAADEIDADIKKNNDYGH